MSSSFRDHPIPSTEPCDVGGRVSQTITRQGTSVTSASSASSGPLIKRSKSCGRCHSDEQRRSCVFHAVAKKTCAEKEHGKEVASRRLGDGIYSPICRVFLFVPVNRIRTTNGFRTKNASNFSGCQPCEERMTPHEASTVRPAPRACAGPWCRTSRHRSSRTAPTSVLEGRRRRRMDRGEVGGRSDGRGGAWEEEEI